MSNDHRHQPDDARDRFKANPPMSPIRSLVLVFGCATVLSSCNLFKKDPPAQDPYAAANPYAPGVAAGQPQGYPAAGAYDAGNAYGQPAPGGYAPPSYSQPPAPTAPGYASTPPAGNYNVASGSGRAHKVVSGDNLTKIATRYGVTVGALKSANNLQTDLIRQGETLRIP